MPQIHSFIYGISPTDNTVRKITVSRDGTTLYLTLGSLQGHDATAVRNIVEHDHTPLQEARRLFDIDEAIEVPADLDESAVGEKARADLEVKALRREETAAKVGGKI